MKKSLAAAFEIALVSAVALAGCGDSSSNNTGAADAGATDTGCTGAGCPGPTDGGASLPSDPSGYAAWLTSDAYRSWRCDPSPQAPLPDSPHGRNVICVNPTLDGARGATGAWPVGSAAVKVIYDAMGRETARFLDVRRNAEAGVAGWYFLRLPMGGMPGPTGMGSEMNIAMACGTCHAAGGRDYVRRVP